MKGSQAIRDMVETAADFEASSETIDQSIVRLAALPPFEYDRIRVAEAIRLGVRVSTLDEEIRSARGRAKGEPSDSADIDFLAYGEPWPDPVDAANLLDGLTETVSRHLVLPSGGAEAIALWVIHAHAHSSFEISPVLGITSPTPECGKTTCLTLLGALVPRPCSSSNITAAALFRAVEMWQPTLLIDEADTFLQASDELRGVLNSGHQRANAYVIRTTGDEHEPKRFRTWAPKAVALIGKLPATLASRAIHIKLRRKTAGENIVPLRLDRLGDLEPLRRKAARSAADNAARLRSADPEMPGTLSGRAADNWRPLIAVADLAGGGWPIRARRIAELLCSSEAEQTASIVLLQDIKHIFAARGVDRLSSAELALALSVLEDRPWPEWHKGKAITPRQIATLLEPFGVTPGTVRLAGDTAKGYMLVAFDDAFARYVTDPSVTPSQAPKSGGFGRETSVTYGGDVSDGKRRIAPEYEGCDGVTASEGGESRSSDDLGEIPACLDRRKRVAI